MIRIFLTFASIACLASCGSSASDLSDAASSDDGLSRADAQSLDGLSTPSDMSNTHDMTSGTDAAQTLAANIIECGATTCDNRNQFCCMTLPTDTPHCCLRQEYYSFAMCQDDADCVGIGAVDGPHCCLESWTGSLDAVCYGTCSGGTAYKSCKIAADCPSGTPCVSSVCHGMPYKTCGGLPVNACP